MKCVNGTRHHWKHGYQCEKCGVHREEYLNDIRKPNNRKIIESRCHERNLKIHSLEYIRNRDYQYGDSWDSSYWELSIYLSESKIETYDTSLGDNTIQGIELMFEQIDEDLNNIQMIYNLDNEEL